MNSKATRSAHPGASTAKRRGNSKPRELSAEQALFVSEFLIDRNATQAAIRAGYSRKTARSIGQENLTKPDIAAAIEKGEKAIAERNELSQDQVVEELRLLAFANMFDYMKVGRDGEPYIDLSDLTREQAAALHDFSVEDFVDGRGKDGRVVRRIKIKLADKRAALVDLGRHLGMFRDRVEISGKHGRPISVANTNVDLSKMSAEEAARIYKEFMR